MLLKNRVSEILRFCFVGGVSFFIDYGLLYFGIEVFKLNYLISSAIAFSIAVIVNYFLCIQFVFKQVNSQNKKVLIIFIGSSIVGLILNQICMYSFVEVLKIHYLIAKIFATAIVTVWNYVMKRKAVVR